MFFGLAAISTIFLRPQDTANNFAWPIKPDVMAAALGAFYLASASIFVLALFAKTWEQVRVMTLPTAAFSTAMLGATVLHWDKFSVGTFPFVVWFASYVLPPPIFVGLYVWHQRRAAPVGTGITEPMVPWVRTLLRVNGLAVTGIAILGFAVPSVVADVGPWAFTPLTARTLCGWLLAVGLMQVSMAWEGDWRRARLATTMMILLPFALVGQLLRFSDEVDWDAVSLWVLLADTSWWLPPVPTCGRPPPLADGGPRPADGDRRAGQPGVLRRRRPPCPVGRLLGVLRALPGGRGPPIPRPPLHARFLGAMYLSGLTLQIAGLTASRWATIRVVPLITAVWTGGLFVVSLLHLEVFDFGAARVIIWFAAYSIYIRWSPSGSCGATGGMPTTPCPVPPSRPGPGPTWGSRVWWRRGWPSPSSSSPTPWSTPGRGPSARSWPSSTSLPCWPTASAASSSPAGARGPRYPGGRRRHAHLRRRGPAGLVPAPGSFSLPAQTGDVVWFAGFTIATAALAVLGARSMSGTAP